MSDLCTACFRARHSRATDPRFTDAEVIAWHTGALEETDMTRDDMLTTLRQIQYELGKRIDAIADGGNPTDVAEVCDLIVACCNVLRVGPVDADDLAA